MKYLICILLFSTYSFTALKQQFLYAPTRGTSVPVATSDQTKQAECKLCAAIEPNNPREFPIARTEHFTISLNPFPYTKAHLMIISNTHNETFDSLSEQKRNELGYLISISTTHLKEAFKCPGINVGYNEGRCSGSSIPGHFHIHVVPRYEYHEKTFLHVIANTQIVQWDYKDIQQKLIPLFAACLLAKHQQTPQQTAAPAA